MKLTNSISAAKRILLAGSLVATSLLQAAADPARTAASSAMQRFQLPGTGTALHRQVLWLAIDEGAFPLRQGLALFLTKPAVRVAPVMAPSASPDAPDNVATHFYGSVLHEQGRFRMWYYAAHATSPEGGLAVSPICYAESPDGENWTRPSLGQVEWRGSRANNILAMGSNPVEAVWGASVIRDDDDPSPEARYKMVFYGSQPRRLGTAISPDGLHWQPLPNSVTGTQFAELGSFYKHGGLYIVSTHMMGHAEGDRPEARQGYAWISPDFEHWLSEAAPSFKTPEPLIGSGWGTHDEAGKGKGHYTQDHIGVGGVSKGNVVVGVYGMWNQREPNWGEGGITCDLGLVVSHDGIHFDEVVKGLPYIRSEESSANPVPGKKYPTILTQGNGILNVGDETLIYHGRWRNVDFQLLNSAVAGTYVAKNYWAGVGLARLPRDRWGALALSAKEEKGAVWTSPVTLAADCRLTINGSGLDGLRVEVADAQFRPLPEFTQGRAGGSANDAFDAEIDWLGHPLRELAGKTVRFRLHFTRSATTNPKLFALNLLRQP